MELLILNGHDYSKHIKAKGYGWERNDLDTEKTVRTKDGRLRRDKIGTKRKLRYSVAGLTREQLAQLDDDLSRATFRARFMDLHGAMEREFYCSGFSATLNTVYADDAGSWEAAEFSMIEV